MNRDKQLTAKKAWGQLSERARLGEKFGQIAMLGLLYKSGKISRQEVIEALNLAGVTREDLKRFREQRFGDLAEPGEEIPESVDLISDREPTAEEVRYGLTLEPIAQDCLARNRSKF